MVRPKEGVILLRKVIYNTVLPLSHAAVAYLCYVTFAAVGTHRLPARLALIPLVIGSQFPDLVDKPLAYTEVLTYGRSLAHSVLAFVLASTIIWWVADRLETRWGETTWQYRLRAVAPAAFAIGYASHLVGDAYKLLLAGNYFQARFLLYPLYVLPESTSDDIAPWVRLFTIYREMGTHPHLEVILVAVAVFGLLNVRAYRQRRHGNRDR